MANGVKEEKEMRNAFFEQASALLALPERFEKAGGSLLVGFESEVAVRPNFDAEDVEKVRDKIIASAPEITDVELGASQIEFRTPPVDILAPRGICEITSLYEKNFGVVADAARRGNCSLLRMGSNPFLPVKHIQRTNRLKYRMVPDFYNGHRPKTADTMIGLGKRRIDIGDAAIISLFQSFQVNLEAQSFEDACDKMNRSFVIAPYLLALSANARYLEFSDLEIEDMRMLAWERSHDTGIEDLRLLSWEKAFDLRTPREVASGMAHRVGLPERYFSGIADYLLRAGNFPFIMHNPDAALGIAVGMTWLDARVKFIGDSLVVELRLLPTQPALEEELLLAFLYIGRLHWAQCYGERLMPIELVRENRLSAMLYGAKKSMWFLSKSGEPERLAFGTGIKAEIQKAKLGLSKLGIAGALDCGLLGRVLKEGSPSQRLGRALQNAEGDISARAMKEALEKTKMIVD